MRASRFERPRRRIVFQSACSQSRPGLRRKTLHQLGRRLPPRRAEWRRLAASGEWEPASAAASPAWPAASSVPVTGHCPRPVRLQSQRARRPRPPSSASPFVQAWSSQLLSRGRPAWSGPRPLHRSGNRRLSPQCDSLVRAEPSRRPTRPRSRALPRPREQLRAAPVGRARPASRVPASAGGCARRGRVRAPLAPACGPGGGRARSGREADPATAPVLHRGRGIDRRGRRLRAHSTTRVSAAIVSPLRASRASAAHARHADQPPAERIGGAGRVEPRRQDEERGLEGVVGAVRADQSAANAIDDRPVPAHEFGEGVLVAARGEAVEQFAIRRR